MSYQDYYQKQLLIGQQFEEYVINRLKDMGFTLNRSLTKDQQYEYGDTLERYEIKRDSFFRRTGQLWIEISEKRSPKNISYVKSGVFNNSRFYVIGDEITFWVFNTKKLLTLANIRTAINKIFENNRKTSNGYFLTTDGADKHCEFKFEKGRLPDGICKIA